MINRSLLGSFLIIIMQLVMMKDFTFAQSSADVRFHHLSLEDGLSQSTIYDMVQDENGFIWFGTLDGLNKYDGYSFTIYRNDFSNSNTISNNEVTALDSRDSILWIGTRNGLNLMNLKNRKITRFFHNSENLNSISHNFIKDIEITENGKVWIGTENGLNCYNPESHDFTRYKGRHDNSNSLPGNDIWDIFVENNNVLWLATSHGISRFNIASENFRNYYLPDKPQNEQVIRDVFLDSEGIVWIGTNSQGLYFLDQNTEIISKEIDGFDPSIHISDARIREIYEDENNIIWIGTYVGLCRFNPENNKVDVFQTITESNYSLSNNKVISIYEDRQNILWIGTFGGGVNKIIPGDPKFNLLEKLPYTKNTLNSNIILSIYVDLDGIVWIGTDKGLNRVDLLREEVKQYNYRTNNALSISDNVIYAITNEGEKYLWLGTGRGILNKFDKITGTVVEKHDMTRMDYKGQWHLGVRALLNDSKGNLWIGTHSGLTLRPTGSREFVNFQVDTKDTYSLSSNLVYDVFEDSNGIIWVGTNHGLNRYDPSEKSFRQFYTSNGLSNNTIRDIDEISPGYLCIATSGGLNIMNTKDNKVVVLSTQNSDLPSDLVYSVEISDSLLWLGTNYGLSAFSLNTFEFKNFSTDDGLQSNEFNQGASYKSTDGYLFFGGIDGLNYFQPKQLYENKDKPQVVISSIELYNKPLGEHTALKLGTTPEYIDTLILSHKMNYLTFEFAAIHFQYPPKNRYRYNLSGIDQQWNYPKNRRVATYTNLPPGKYTFLVYGSNSDGVWSDKPAKVIIYIKPPFWKKTWFNVMLIFVLVSGLVLYIKMRERHLRGRNIILENSVQERTKTIQAQKNKILSQRDDLSVLNEELTQQKEELVISKDHLENRNKQLTDSLIYAKNIQSSIFPSSKEIKRLFSSYFIFYQPKEHISGDFYWIESVEVTGLLSKNNKRIIYFAVVDCTGHGVPGALMSIIGKTILDQAIHIAKLRKPSEILTFVDHHLNKTLRQSNDQITEKEGMDMAICAFHPDEKILEFAGAMNPIFLIRNKQMNEFKAEPFSVGMSFTSSQKVFKNQVIAVENNDHIYLSTDGFFDQFGGPKRKKILRKRFKEILLECNHMPMAEQKDHIQNFFYQWKGKRDQIDDVLVMGIKI